MFLSERKHSLTISATLALLLTLVLPMFAQAKTNSVSANVSQNITSVPATSVQTLVPATVQWVNTGITVNSGDGLQISATGSWSADPTDGPTTPNGYAQPSGDNFLNLTDIGSCSVCAGTPTPYWGALIGYIGNNPPPAGSYTNPAILPEAQKVFLVGSSFGATEAVSGTLWLNFNDDAYSNNTSDNSGQVVASITDTPPSSPLGGKWISPANNFVVAQNSSLHMSAHAYGGIGGVNHVNFTVWWPALGNGPWFVACKVFNPTPGTTDQYDCTWNLKDGNGKAVPAGTIKVGFDVYDNGGNRVLSPDGVRTGRIQPREKLVILLQGILSALNPDDIAQKRIPGFDQPGEIIPFLKSHGFNNAKFMAYSYNGLNSQGQLQPYFCEITFNQSIYTDEFKLDDEITSYLKIHPNTDIYLVGHSLGGVIAFGYLAFLRAFNYSLPNGGKLAGVITLDAPIGGITDNKDYFSAIKNFVHSQCDLLSNFQSVKDLVAIFKTASSSHPQGGKASFKKVVFGGKFLSNQQLADEALAHGISILTIGNITDFLWNTAACRILPKVSFLSTQVIGDEGKNSKIYGRVFQGGDQKCQATTILLGSLNHLEVLTNLLVEKGILNFLPSGTEPVPLKPPSKGF